MCFFFQAEDGIRDLVRSRGLGDVYKRQASQFLLRDARRLQLLDAHLHLTDGAVQFGALLALSLIHI